ncbi:hypothetical protein ACV8TN_00760 [Citrobacter freundii]|uniref:hypothetical protein n=1 Tax=Citrobacter freundii TaxID=546 RepID=UPI00301C108D
MTVNTQTLTVGSTWIQVTDGTQTKTVQVNSGAVRLADATTSPGVGYWQGHILTDNDDNWATITPPTIAWIRTASNDGDSAEVTIS